jgi:hypothetical protein
MQKSSEITGHEESHLLVNGMFALPSSDDSPAKIESTMSIGNLQKRIEQAGQSYQTLIKR